MSTPIYLRLTRSYCLCLILFFTHLAFAEQGVSVPPSLNQIPFSTDYKDTVIRLESSYYEDRMPQILEKGVAPKRNFHLSLTITSLAKDYSVALKAGNLFIYDQNDTLLESITLDEWQKTTTGWQQQISLQVSGSSIPKSAVIGLQDQKQDRLFLKSELQSQGAVF